MGERDSFSVVQKLVLQQRKERRSGDTSRLQENTPHSSVVESAQEQKRAGENDRHLGRRVKQGEQEW